MRLTACAFFGTASEEVKIKDQLAASFEGAADIHASSEEEARSRNAWPSRPKRTSGYGNNLNLIHWRRAVR